MVYTLNVDGPIHSPHAMVPTRFTSASLKKTPIQVFNEKFEEMVSSRKGKDNSPPTFHDVVYALDLHTFLEITHLSLKVKYEINQGTRWGRTPIRFGFEDSTTLTGNGFVPTITPVLPKRVGFITPIPYSQLQASLLILSSSRIPT